MKPTGHFSKSKINNWEKNINCKTSTISKPINLTLNNPMKNMRTQDTVRTIFMVDKFLYV
jgi:hypothetical protein